MHSLERKATIFQWLSALTLPAKLQYCESTLTYSP